MKTMNNAVRKIVPLCISILLLIGCGIGIGSVTAESNEVYLGDVYLNALYETIGTMPIAGNESGWTNIKTGKSLSFTPEGNNKYYIADSATSAATTQRQGTYTKAINGMKYQIDVKYPTVTVSGYMYLARDLPNPAGHLFGEKPTTDYYIKISTPATFSSGCKVAGIGLTNPEKSLTQIFGKKNGDTIEFLDSLAGYDTGIWTVTPVFQNGHENGFSNLAPSYMYGEEVSFTVRKADHTIDIRVTNTTTPVPTPSSTAKLGTYTPVFAPVQTKDISNLTRTPDSSVQNATPAHTQDPATSTQESPAPLIGLLAGLGVAAVLLRRKE